MQVVHGIMLKNILKEEIMAARKVNAIKQVLLVIPLVIHFKDTCGPSMNILIKLMSMVAVVMAGVTVAWSIFG